MGEQPSGGQVALVSGASRGIGLGIARGLTRAGHRVALVARPSEALERVTSELGERALAVSADVTESAEVTRAVAQAEEATRAGRPAGAQRRQRRRGRAAVGS